MKQNRLSRLTKILYGSGDIGLSLTGTILAAYFAIFLTDVVGVSPAIAAIAIFIGRTSDYINDPIIGHISDRTRSRWGRRRPFLLFGALPYALAFTMLWWRPPLHGDVLLAFYYAVAYIIFDAAATFVYMPYYSLTPELSSDYDERTSLTSYRMFFSIVASLVAFTVPLVIIGNFSAENASRVWTMGVIFALISAAPMLLVFFGTRERPDHMNLEQPALRDSLKAAVKNKPFLYAAGIFLLTWVTIDIIQTTMLYFIKYVIKLENQSDLLMAAIFITAMASLPFWNWVSRRWSKRQAYIGGIAFLAVVLIVLIMLNGTTPQAVILLICILAGIGVGAAHVLPWAIMPDTMEYDEWQSGERHEGMLYSLVTTMQKVASSIAIPLVLLLLDVTGYVPNSATQPASALLGIRIVIGPITAVLLIIAIFLALRYPLNREFFSRIMKDLEKRHSEIK